MSKFFYIFLFIALIAGCEKSPGNFNISEEVDSSEEIYIPQNLDECFSELKKILEPKDVENMKKGTEDEMAKYHFSLGMWMRNNWGLWKDSRLSKWFNEQGIHHPDDMSGIILTSFWRHLNNKPIEIEKQIEFYQEYWKSIGD